MTQTGIFVWVPQVEEKLLDKRGEKMGLKCKKGGCYHFKVFVCLFGNARSMQKFHSQGSNLRHGGDPSHRNDNSRSLTSRSPRNSSEFKFCVSSTYKLGRAWSTPGSFPHLKTGGNFSTSFLDCCENYLK